MTKFLLPVLSFLLGIVATWVFDDTLKPAFQRRIEEPVSHLVPWESAWVQAILPSRIVFEASEINGCSGGELAALAEAAAKQGLGVKRPDIVKQTRLCAPWYKAGTAKRVLTSMADRFDRCFSITDDQFDVRTSDEYVCRTTYAIDPQTNGWSQKPGAATILCSSKPSAGRPSQDEPYIRDCSKEQLQAAQIPK